MQTLLISLLHSPMPATVDSMCVAGLLELLRTKGLWLASARYGYLFGGLRESGNLAARAPHLWSRERLLAVGALFEATWARVVERAKIKAEAGAPSSSPPKRRMSSPGRLSKRPSCSTKPSVPGDGSGGGVGGGGASSGDIELGEAAMGGAAGGSRQLTMASLRNDMVDAMTEPLCNLLLHSEGSPGFAVASDDGIATAASVMLLIEVSVDAFIGNDLYCATRQLLGGAKGSFGLVTSHSLDATDELVVAARGQTMSVACYPQMGVVLFGSEAAATKVGMGEAINANLFSEEDLAQLASGPAQDSKGSNRSTTSPNDSLHRATSFASNSFRRRPQPGRTSRDSLRPPSGRPSTDSESNSSFTSIAHSREKGAHLSQQRSQQQSVHSFGKILTLTGDTLNAILQLNCEFSGAAYAIYWKRRGGDADSEDVFVVAADFITPAQAASLAARGVSGSMAAASRQAQMKTSGSGEVASCFRTGQPRFIKDAKDIQVGRLRTAFSSPLLLAPPAFRQARWLLTSRQPTSRLPRLPRLPCAVFVLPCGSRRLLWHRLSRHGSSPHAPQKGDFATCAQALYTAPRPHYDVSAAALDTLLLAS